MNRKKDIKLKSLHTTTKNKTLVKP